MAKKLFLILNVVCATAFSQNLELSALTVNPELSQGADSVLRNEEITLDLSDPGKLKTTISRVVTVYNKVGLGDVAAYAHYDNNSKVNDIEAVIYDMAGREKDKVKKRDFKDFSAVDGGTLYADSRVLYLDYTPTSYPFTIQFTSETTSETTAFIRPWMPISKYDSGTEFSKFTVIYPPEQKPHIKETHFEGYAIEKEELEDRTIWTAKDIAPITWEYHSPALDKRVPRVKCFFDSFYLEGVPGIAKTWKDFGSWMYNDLVKDTQDLDEATLAEVRALVANLEDDEAKARAIYQYVQDKVRYISVQVEIGGWKPMNASDVHRLGYGDCKALSNYTQSLLKAVGIKSYYTVLYGDPGKESLETDVVAIQGNHAILGVQLGDEIKFLECTSQETPFGYMGTFTDDRDVLLLTEDGGKLARTTKYEQDQNVLKLYADFKFDVNGGLEGSLSRSSKGIYYSSRMQLDRMDQKELTDHYYSTFDAINNLSVSAIELNNDRLGITYDERMKAEASNYATKVGEDFLLRPNTFALTRDAIPPRYAERKSDLIILRGTIQNQEVRIQVPEGYAVDALPEGEKIEEAFGSYTTEYLLEGSELLYKRSLKFNEGQYDKAAYETYRDFYKSIVKQDNQKVLIKKL